MPTLVSPSEVVQFLGIASDEPDAPAALAIADQVEALLIRQCGRDRRPFQLAQSARVERRDGTGRPVLYLDYPIAALTSVVLGYVVASPDETLVVNDQAKLSWAVGSPRLTRVDGGVFGWPDQPGCVHITYDTQSDVPLEAGLAVLQVTAAVFNSRGSEGGSERLGGYAVETASEASLNPLWQQVVGGHRLVYA